MRNSKQINGCLQVIIYLIARYANHEHTFIVNVA